MFMLISREVDFIVSLFANNIAFKRQTQGGIVYKLIQIQSAIRISPLKPHNVILRVKAQVIRCGSRY